MDRLHRFLFEDMGVRGELVQMEASWQAILGRYDYPASVRRQLGEAVAAALLMSATIKFQGSLILQSQSSGPLTTLVAQASHRQTVRGLARWRGEVPQGDLQAMYGEGHMAITIDTPGKERYQGIVALQGSNLSQALEGYFHSSEQLPSRFWLAADGQHAAGLFIQQLPGAGQGQDDWERISLLAATLTDAELLQLDAAALLYRLFHEEPLRLFEGEPVAFRCSCSHERIESTLKTLGYAEVKSIINEQGGVAVDCDFCNRHYHFDPIDIETLFAQEVHLSGSPRQQ